MSTNTKSKPQAAIEAGLMDRNEAAEYLGMSIQAFNTISRQIPSARLGPNKYYDRSDLLKYLANIQRISRNTLQPIEH